MQLKKIQDADVRGKKVLVRVDFNESVNEQGDVKSAYKIMIAKDTITHLIDNGAAYIALLSHFGRPESKDDRSCSLEQITDDVARVLGRDVRFVSDCIGQSVQNAMSAYANGQVLLLENVRYHDGEEKDDSNFAGELCANFDIYINEAFAVSHRAHASVHAITKCMPSFAGLWVQKEIENLAHIKMSPIQPAVAIIGGAKIETKLPMITEFSRTYDTVLVGGRSAVEVIENKMTLPKNVVLPSDFAYQYFDIGPHTIQNFTKYIRSARTIVWNGPMGKIEDDEYKKGTLALIEAMAQNTEAFSLIGGGESVQMVEESGFLDKISFVSTGGGAMLAYLGGESMPGIDVLIR